MTIRGTLRRLDTAVTRRGDTRRILVDSRTAVNYGIVSPIVRAMAADPRVQFAFTASEEPHRLREIYLGAPPGHRLIRPARAALTRWDAYLASDFMWATLPRGTARVQIFHGVAGKYDFDAPTVSLRMWSRLFFINERRLRNCIAAGALDEGSPSIRLIGMPRADCLVDGSLRRDDILRSVALDPSTPTVLYAPTWSPASSLNRMGIDLIERLLAMPINVIVKLHDRSRDRRPRYSGGIDWPARLAPMLARSDARLASGHDITPWLAAADVMITDHSSAGFEYLLLDRPLIRIEIPDLIRQAHVHADYVELLASASRNVTTAPEAANAVASAVADPQGLSAMRQRVAADLFYRPGTATARATAALYELLEIPAVTSVRARATTREAPPAGGRARGRRQTARGSRHASGDA